MPVHKGRLKEADFTKIQMNYVYLMRELDGRSLVNEMFASRVFTLDDKQEIEGEHTRDGRTEKFLQKLLDSGPDTAYDVFLLALEIHYPHVAQTLKVNVSGEGGNYSKDTPDGRKHVGRQWCEEQADTFHMIPPPGSEHWLECKKNPGHKDFIPLSSFDTSHLPSHFQQPEVVDYVKVLAEQTVLLQNEYISSNRPEGYPDSKNTGKYTTNYGTGRVWRMMRNFSQLDSDTCPCGACKNSSSPARQWGQCIVVTAKNIVFDDTECANTKFMLWYDEPQPDIKSYPALVGVRMIRSDIVNDYSEVLCVTHDKVVNEKLEAICSKNEDLSTKLARMCYEREPNKRLTIIISHPHNASKHVTVGEWVNGNNAGPVSTNKHAYTAATCFGSTGAPVLLLDERMSCCTTHSGYSVLSSRNESWGKLWQL